MSNRNKQKTRARNHFGPEHIRMHGFPCEHKDAPSHYASCAHLQQDETLPTAHERYKPWSSDEIEFVRDTFDHPLGEIADALGRTYYATANARHRIIRGEW